MKYTIILSLLFALLTSCGKSGSSSSGKGPSSNPVTESTKLTGEEEELSKELLNLGSLTQKDLMIKLTSLKTMSSTSLKKLDLVLNVECSKSDGLCFVTSKE